MNFRLKIKRKHNEVSIEILEQKRKFFHSIPKVFQASNGFYIITGHYPAISTFSSSDYPNDYGFWLRGKTGERSLNSKMAVKFFNSKQDAELYIFRLKVSLTEFVNQEINL